MLLHRPVGWYACTRSEHGTWFISASRDKKSVLTYSCEDVTEAENCKEKVHIPYAYYISTYSVCAEFTAETNTQTLYTPLYRQ